MMFEILNVNEKQDGDRDEDGKKEDLPLMLSPIDERKLVVRARSVNSEAHMPYPP
jgi:hypothetical protein